LYAIYIKFSGISNEESVKCGERGEIPDQVGDDKEGCGEDISGETRRD
jgi:hypothetical protein